MSNTARTLNWNGKDLPAELVELPPGQYVIEAVESQDELGLSEEQVEGLRQASRSLDAGKGAPWAEVRDRLRRRVSQPQR